jgi:Flp pilus assembly protein TadB
MMAIMPAVLLVIYYFIDPEAVTMLFTQPLGRVVLLAAAGLIFAGFIWIRRIMTVDI